MENSEGEMELMPRVKLEVMDPDEEQQQVRFFRLPYIQLID